MSGMKSGQLLWKKELEQDFGPCQQEKGGQVSFIVRTKVKGIQAPVSVRVFAHVFEEDFLQLWDYTVEYASVALGEKRTEILCQELQRLLYTQAKYYAPIAHKDFFVYGYHYAFGSHYGTRSVTVVKQKEQATFELLAEETAEHLGETVTYRYYYDPTEQLLLEHKSPNAWDDWWASGKQKEVLYDLQSYNHVNTHQIVDETGRIYLASKIAHPAHIQLFHLKRTGRKYRLHTPLGLYRLMKKSTYHEALEELALAEGRLATNFTETLPYTKGCLTIHSKRVIGDVLSNYPVGTWVETESGKIGVTTAPREGKLYEVCLEDAYLPGFDDTLHNQMKPIDNPCRAFEAMKQPIARFCLHTPKFVYCGFGYVLEERPSVYKIKPVSKFEEGVASTLHNEVIDELRYHRRRREVTMQRMQEIHGTDLDFLLFKKADVTMLNEEETHQWQAFLTDAHVSNEQKVFENLLMLQTVHRFNWDYVLMELLSYTTFDTMTHIVKKLTELMLYPQEATFMYALLKWFEKMAIKKRIMTS